MLRHSIRVRNCIGGVPEPKLSHFVGTVAAVCPRACSCLFSIHMPVVACPQPGSSAWIIPVSRAGAVEVEARHSLRPRYPIVFANKAVVGERPRFPSVQHSSASILSSPTSHHQDSAAVGCFSEQAISNRVIWSSDRKQRDLNTLEKCKVGLGGQRAMLSHSHF